MKYLAILSRQPEIGLAELEAVLGKDNVVGFGKHAILQELPNIDQLGGTIKLVQIMGSYPGAKLDIGSLNLSAIPLPVSKITFGVSCYNINANTTDLLRFGLELKKILRKNGQNVRFVESKSPSLELNAAQITHNQLLTNGFDLVIVSDGQTAHWGVTVAIQNIDAYSKRDYDRPMRSAKVGMLPPKLAQILLNLAGGDTIYDPFCGTGVVLQEALLMGKRAYGSDIAIEMVDYTKKNLAWLATESSQSLPIWSATVADAKTLSIPIGIQSIISEGYLGPNMSKLPDNKQLDDISNEISSLYQSFLAQVAKQVDPGFNITICLPAWKTPKGYSLPKVIDQISDLGYTTKRLQASKDQSLIYHRPGQLVGRYILNISKN